MRRLDIVKAVPGIGLVATGAYSVYTAAYPGIFFPWYFNTEEFPYIQEILRFAELDFRQQFFDIPGTPLIALVTCLWWPFYWVSVVLGDAPEGIRVFNFAHLQQLYILSRSVSIVAFCASLALTYRIALRLLSPVGAVIAATLLALHPLFGNTLYHLRIEPVNLALVLTSVWLVLRALEGHSYCMYFLSGLAAGIGMAARYPSIMASLPVLLAFAAVRRDVFSEKRHCEMNVVFSKVICSILLAGGSLALALTAGWTERDWLTDVFLITVESGNYPLAIRAIRKMWIVLASAAAVYRVGFVLPSVRRFLGRVESSSAITIVAGAFVGFLTGAATLLWSGQFFLRSVEMFIERNSSGIWQTSSLFDTAVFYLFGVLPGNAKYFGDQFGVCSSYVHTGALLSGAVLIAFRARQDTGRLLAPLLLGVVLGIVGQHGKMQATRHVVAWLPFFAIVMALPIDAACAAIRKARWRACLAVGAFACAVMVSVGPRQKLIGPDVQHFVEKLTLIPEMNQWLSRIMLPGDKSFHVCCETANSEVILSWMKMNGVAMPQNNANFRHMIWFGDRQSLEGAGRGYIVISKHTYRGAYIEYYKKVKPDALVDPYTDGRFRLLREFQPGTNAVWQVFRFDFQGGRASL